MVISDDEVRQALTYLRRHVEDRGEPHPRAVSEDLMTKVIAALHDLPDTRDDRVAQAIERLATDPPSADAVAERIISRAISDSLR